MCKETQKPPAKHSIRAKDGRLKKNQFKQRIIQAFEKKGIWCSDVRRPTKTLFPLTFILIDRIHALSGDPQKDIIALAEYHAKRIARQDGIEWGLNKNDEHTVVLDDL